VEMLADYLPEEMDAYWSATLNGIYLPSPHLIATAKKQGLRRGPLDLMFLWPDGVTTFIEMKRDPKAVLKPEQKLWAERLGPERFARCESWAAVKAVLTPMLERHGLRWLTEAEAWRRRAARQEAKRQRRMRNRPTWDAISRAKRRGPTKRVSLD
jgi:hypothetical protein